MSWNLLDNIFPKGSTDDGLFASLIHLFLRNGKSKKEMNPLVVWMIDDSFGKYLFWKQHVMTLYSG